MKLEGSLEVECCEKNVEAKGPMVSLNPYTPEFQMGTHVARSPCFLCVSQLVE